MTFLTQHLPFTSFSPSSAGHSQALPPNGSHVLITDTLASPAHFILYHLVSAAIARKTKVIWVDFRNEGRASWETVLKKLGTPLPPPSSPQFVHLTPSAHEDCTDTRPSSSLLPLFEVTGRPTLKPTYDAICKHILTLSSDHQDSSGPLVLLDGQAELIWMGFEPEDVGRFVRAVFTRARATNSILVSTLHVDPYTSPSSPETALLSRLLRLGSGGWFRVSELASGRSGDVYGEISAHPNFCPSGTFPTVSKSHPLQYRLEASTVKVFPKGTGRGFL